MMSSAAPFVLSLCDRTGIMVRDWADAGAECVCVDLQHPIRTPRVERVGAGTITYQWGDARSTTPETFGQRRPVMVFAFPPCTDLANSGARDYARKGLRRLIDALEVVESCRLLCEWYGCAWMLENPVGRLTKLWREPDYSFNPCDYGDPYTKRTGIWCGGSFIMPQLAPVEPTQGSKIALMGETKGRANARAETPPGFARSVFLANAPWLMPLAEGVA